MNNLDLDRAKKFVYRNARPLDLYRWKYHFEGGEKDDVLKALISFQNKDGGFGHGLELDCLNPNSSPIQTWKAMTFLEELDILDSNNSIIQGILRYLESGKDFDSSHYQWKRVIPSNNHFPHAIWWEYNQANDLYAYNPTAYFAGFIIKYAEKDSSLYKKGRRIIQEAFETLKKDNFEADTLNCFSALYAFLKESKTKDIIPLKELEKELSKRIPDSIEKDSSNWYVTYVTTPSYVIKHPSSPGAKESFDYIEKELEMIPIVQKVDGSFGVTWKWYNDYPEYNASKLLWESEIIIDKLLFYKNFHK